MAEAVGLVLGIAGILVPAYEGYHRCSAVIADTKSFPRKFRTFKLALKTQKDIFSGECELLLKGFVDNNVLQKMLRDQEHEQWRDVGFQVAFCAHLGGSLEDKLAPFKAVREALDEIMEEVTEFEEKVNSGTSPTTSSRLAGASRKIKCIGHKFDWALSKKTKLEGFIETLRKQNGVLLQLRNQAEAKAKLQYTPQQNKTFQQDTTSSLSEYLAIQEVSMKLHKALADTAICHCHNINLRLDSEPRDSTRIKFRFVLTEDSNICTPNQNILQGRCTCLLVESGPGAIRLSAEDSRVDYNGCKKPQMALSDKQAVAHKKPEKKTGRKVQFDMGPSAVELEGSFAVGYAASGGGIGSVATATSQAVLEVIDDLCNFLKKTSDIGVGQSTCLGYVRSDDSYNHIVYKDFPEALEPTSRISLSSLLSSLNMSEKQRLWPRGDRLKLGLALSLSVLHFGSYTNSWFKEHWRSQDIYFFGNPQRRELLSIGSPHVATSFGSCLEDGLSDSLDGDDGNVDVRRTGTTLARNEQLFSLAIVLIEIAYGDLLCNIFESGNQRTEGPKRLDEFAEYLKAKTVSEFIGREMGKKYADVVKRCLYCDFGIDESDLSKRKLQEVFFTNVVCTLEQCVRQFSD